ncbi:MAG: secretion protein HlyD family protein, partial [Planctomycetaceae bacterium]|nr:secretion protein HlyD family protein [Planctomycetaceae bacterium]
MDTPTAGPRPRSRAEEVVATNSGLSDRVRSLRLPDRAAQPRSTATVAWILVLLLSTLSAVLGYREAERNQLFSLDSDTADAPQTSDSEPTPVQSQNSLPATTAQEGAIALESKGYLIPAHQILVSPKVSGMIIKLYIVEGEKVKKGEVLAELEKDDYQADFNRAKAALLLAKARRDLILAGSRSEERDQAEAEVAEAERQLEQQKADHLRNEMLRSKDKSLVADATFETQKSLYEASLFRVKRLKFRRDQIVNGNRKEDIAASEAEVQQAEADLEKAAWKVSNCTIRAPISGSVLKKNAEEGNIVNTIAPNGSFSLCDLADLSDLEVDLSIQERDISKIYAKQKCTIRSEAYPDRQYIGVVDRLLPIADRAKGAIP